MTVAGFGGSPFVSAYIANNLINTVQLLNTFLYLGIAFLIISYIARDAVEVSRGRMEAGGMGAQRQAPLQPEQTSTALEMVEDILILGTCSFVSSSVHWPV